MRTPRSAAFGAAATLALALWVAPGSGRAEGPAELLVGRVASALSELRLAEARELLRAVPEPLRETAALQQAEALVAFHEGDYAAARRAMEASLRAAPPQGEQDDRLGWLRLIEQAERTASRLVEARSEDGRFVVLHPPGRGEVLVDLAIEAMRRQDEALQRWSGYRHPGPIRLELYEDVSVLADVSTLELEDIERTGIVALCKWDRLMVTSPRFLPHGYAWLDTVAHEMVHLYVSRITFDRAPVWLQEGLAKALERAWREPPEAPVRLRPRLPASVQRLLVEAARKGELVPFEKLHPSIALLGSQREAALAFAQVATLVERLEREHGPALWPEVLRRLQRGADATEVLQRALGRPWERVLADWRRDVAGRELPEAGGIERLVMGAPARDEEAAARRRSGELRRRLRLGDLLWDRGHARAAWRQYEAAWRLAPEDPGVAARFARAALAAAEAAAALRASEALARRHPEDASARAVHAASLLAAGRRGEAAAEAFEALALNPFDPLPHCVLEAAGRDEAERARGSRWCEALAERP